MSSPRPVTACLLSSRADAALRAELEPQLKLLRHEGVLDGWRDLLAEELSPADGAAEDAATPLVVVLVSPALLAAGPALDATLAAAATQGRIVAVLVREAALAGTALAAWVDLPQMDGALLPVAAWKKPAKAWKQVGEQIRQAAREVAATLPEPVAPEGPRWDPARRVVALWPVAALPPSHAALLPQLLASLEALRGDKHHRGLCLVGPVGSGAAQLLVALAAQAAPSAAGSVVQLDPAAALDPQLDALVDQAAWCPPDTRLPEKRRVARAHLREGAGLLVLPGLPSAQVVDALAGRRGPLVLASSTAPVEGLVAVKVPALSADEGAALLAQAAGHPVPDAARIVEALDGRARLLALVGAALRRAPTLDASTVDGVDTALALARAAAQTVPSLPALLPLAGPAPRALLHAALGQPEAVDAALEAGVEVGLLRPDHAWAWPEWARGAPAWDHQAVAAWLGDAARSGGPAEVQRGAATLPALAGWYRPEAEPLSRAWTAALAARAAALGGQSTEARTWLDRATQDAQEAEEAPVVLQAWLRRVEISLAEAAGDRDAARAAALELGMLAGVLEGDAAEQARIDYLALAMSWAEDDAQTAPLREAYEAAQARFGPDSRATLALGLNLAGVLSQQDVGAAQELAQQVHARALRALGPDDVTTAQAFTVRSLLGMTSGRSSTDRDAARQAATVLMRTLGEESPMTAMMRALHGMGLMQERRFHEAWGHVTGALDHLSPAHELYVVLLRLETQLAPIVGQRARKRRPAAGGLDFAALAARYQAAGFKP